MTATRIRALFVVSMPTAKRILANCGGNVTRARFDAWAKECARKGINLAGPPLPRKGAVSRRMGRVYFIEAVGAGRVKIGFTADETVDARRRALQTGCPYRLREVYSFAGTLRDEANLHKRFAGDRVMPDAEWFYDSERLREHIAWLIEVSQ